MKFKKHLVLGLVALAVALPAHAAPTKHHPKHKRAVASAFSPSQQTCVDYGLKPHTSRFWHCVRQTDRSQIRAGAEAKEYAAQQQRLSVKLQLLTAQQKQQQDLILAQTQAQKSYQAQMEAQAQQYALEQQRLTLQQQQQLAAEQKQHEALIEAQTQVQKDEQKLQQAQAAFRANQNVLYRSGL